MPIGERNEYFKEWRANNKEHVSNYRMTLLETKIKCDECGRQISKANFNRHVKTIHLTDKTDASA